MILNRLSHTDLPRNAKYKGISMDIPKEDFINWFMANDFEGASVDRIDNTKNYTMDNIQLIPLSENIRKDRIKSKGGYCECYGCHQIKELSLFAKDKRRLNGYSTICKECDNRRKKYGSTGK